MHKKHNPQWMMHRVKAIRNLAKQGATHDDDIVIPIGQAFGFDAWDDFRDGMTVEMLPQLEALAGPNGYAILKAMLAKREQEREDALNKKVVEGAQR